MSPNISLGCLKRNCSIKFDSIDQLEKAIVAYIGYDNNHRITLKLNGLSPVQYRIQTV